MTNINWIKEATNVIEDVQPFVKDVRLSSNQPDSQRFVLINLETFENEKFCVQLSASGFRITSHTYDTIQESEAEEWYETPYALLMSHSKSYVKRFNDMLITRLQKGDS